MNTDLENILIACLDALERGEPLAAILNNYPDQAEELRPFLETTVLLNNLNLQPTLGAQARSQQAFLAQAESLRTHRPATGWRQGWPRILAPIAGLALFMFLFAATLIPLSARTVPGDALYSFKRLAENTRLSATTNAERKLELIEEYKETRRQEIQSLLAAGQDADDVAFEGNIETIADGVWQIAGIPVQIEADTQIEGRPEVGLAAIVTGVIRQGSLIALSILIPEGGEPMLLPTPWPTPWPTPSPTAVASPTAPATATDTSAPKSTPKATGTPGPINTPQPTVTPENTPTTAPPTAAATDTAVPPPGNDNDDNSNDDNGDNNNDDNDDNSNDNDDNNNEDDNGNGDDNNDDDSNNDNS